MRKLLIAAAIVALSGCVGYESGVSEAPTFGKATAANMAAQSAAPGDQTATDGAKIAGAVERYRADKVKAPERLRGTSATGRSGPDVGATP